MSKKSEPIYTKTKFGINKFDFDSIENKVNNKDEQSKIRYLMLKLSIAAILVMIVSFYFKDENGLAGGFAVFFGVLSVILLILFLIILANPKKAIKDECFKVYKKNIHIIENPPHNLSYIILDSIHLGGHEDYDKAREELIKMAFNLKADAIINFNHTTQTMTNIAGNKNKIQSRNRTIHHMRGVAIKLQ
jgi:hypothetical protein